MKYSLSVNQIAAHSLGIIGLVDLVDLCLFDAFKSFANSKRCEKRIDEGGIWFWISYAEIIKEVPLSGIKTKDGVYRRMLKLRDAGIIVFHPDNQKLAKAFFQWGENYDAMERKDWPECTTDEKPKVQNLRMKPRTPTDETPNPYGSKTEPPTDEKPNNQYTNNQDTKPTTTESEIADADAELLIKSTTEFENVTLVESLALKAEKENPTPVPPAPSPQPAPGESAPRRWDMFDIDRAAIEFKENHFSAENFARITGTPAAQMVARFTAEVDVFVLEQKGKKTPYNRFDEFSSHFFNYERAKVRAERNTTTQNTTYAPTNQKANLNRLGSDAAAYREKPLF